MHSPIVPVKGTEYLLWLLWSRLTLWLQSDLLLLRPVHLQIGNVQRCLQAYTLIDRL